MGVTVKVEKSLHAQIKKLREDIKRYDQELLSPKVTKEKCRKRAYLHFSKTFKKFKYRPAIVGLAAIFLLASIFVPGMGPVFNILFAIAAAAAAVTCIRPLWCLLCMILTNNVSSCIYKRRKKLQNKISEKRARLETMERGLEGELITAAVLEKELPDNYYIANDVKVWTRKFKYFQVDHIVIGPTGVFVIETKHLNGRFYPHAKGWLRQPACKHSSVASRHRLISSPQAQAKQNAGCLQDFLLRRGGVKVEVSHMVVLTNPNCLWMAVEDFGESPVIVVNRLSQRIMAGGRRLPAWLVRNVLFTLPLGAAVD